MTADLLIDAKVLHPFAAAVLVAAGMREAEAAVVADSLVFANLRGVDSHGVSRLRQYVESLESGEVNALPDVGVLCRDGCTALIDADGGYGYVPSHLAAEMATELASLYGCAVVGVRNSHHFGMAGTYAIKIAERGQIGMVTTTTSPVLSPPASSTPVMGNSPYAFAVPRRRPARPLVLDMALSEAAFGKIRLAAKEGRPIPATWALGRDGQPTTDANEALEVGRPLPIGGPKGFGMAVIGAVLAGVLTQSPFGVGASGHRHRDGGVGHFFLAIDPRRSQDLETFLNGVEDLVHQVRSAPTVAPIGDTEPSRLPGDPEWAQFDRRSEHGIPLAARLVEELRNLGSNSGIPLPPELGAEVG